MSYRVFTKPTSSSHSNSPLEDMSAFPDSLFLLQADQYLRLHLNTAFLAKKQLNICRWKFNSEKCVCNTYKWINKMCYFVSKSCLIAKRINEWSFYIINIYVFEGERSIKSLDLKTCILNSICQFGHLWMKQRHYK